MVLAVELRGVPELFRKRYRVGPSVAAVPITHRAPLSPGYTALGERLDGHIHRLVYSVPPTLPAPHCGLSCYPP